MVHLTHSTISPALLRAADAAWPSPEWNGWHRYKGSTGDKFGSLHHSVIPRACTVALETLAEHASAFIGDSFIDYDLHAAGLHMMPPGGFLARHVDAERHPLKQWRRTHSIVLFVNRLNPGDGGRLHIEGQTTLRPEPNVCCIFETPGQWHEVYKTSASAPYRKTLAMFAWSLDDGEGATSSTFAAQSSGGPL